MSKRKKSPVVEVVDIPSSAVQSAGQALHLTFESRSGKRVYYCFVPWTVVVAELRKEGLKHGWRLGAPG